MDNSYFLCTSKDVKCEIKRFHICTWEFNHDSSLIEFGFEILNGLIDIESDKLQFELYVPWLNKDCTITDFYSKLKDISNSRFIFNDSITESDHTDGGKDLSGVTHHFTSRDDLYISPITINPDYTKKKIEIDIDLSFYKTINNRPDIYIRLCIQPNRTYISTRKPGIGKSTILYDLRVNEKRNLPDDLTKDFKSRNLCKIVSCFCFNIVPNRYDLAFFESESLQKVRALEYDSFAKYLGNKKIKKNDLIVIFNKKENSESYSFFSIFAQETIGASQFAVAIFINIFCNTLLFYPSYQKSIGITPISSFLLNNFPIQLDIAIVINLLLAIYLFKNYLKHLIIKQFKTSN